MSESFGLEFVSCIVGVNHVEFYWNKILKNQVVRFSLQ